jgi:hypothetical protein
MMYNTCTCFLRNNYFILDTFHPDTEYLILLFIPSYKQHFVNSFSSCICPKVPISTTLLVANILRNSQCYFP